MEMVDQPVDGSGGKKVQMELLSDDQQLTIVKIEDGEDKPGGEVQAEDDTDVPDDERDTQDKKVCHCCLWAVAVAVAVVVVGSCCCCCCC